MRIKIYSVFACLLVLAFPGSCWAMPPGTLLYRTSSDGKLFGYSQDPLIETHDGILSGINAGHSAIYIGKENGVDYVVEAMGGGIVKTPAKFFVNRADNETFLGARIPKGASPVQLAKVVSIAKSLAERNPGYDFDYKIQKGPADGQWTCVGLLEKLYESANISNPNNLAALEYDPKYYAIDITPDGFDDTSVYGQEGDCFSRNREFSKIARRTNLKVPAPEIFGYDLGLEHDGQRYVFLPYTQFLQPTLSPVAADIEISSSFSDSQIRGDLDLRALVLRWSLINNPISSVKNIASSLKDLAIDTYSKVKNIAQNVSEKIFGTENDSAIVLDDSIPKTQAKKTTKSSSKPVASDKSAATPRVKVNKATTKIKSETNGQMGPNPDTVKTPNETSKSSKGSVSVPSISNKPSVKVAAASSSKTSSAKSDAAVSQQLTSPAAPAYPSVIYNTIPVVSNPPAADTAPKIALIKGIGASGNDDWVELYNYGDKDFDLAAAGYRLEKTKTAEDPSLMIRIGNSEDGSFPGGTVIKAHDSYLIVRAAADPYYRNQADAIAERDDFSWTGSGYTIYVGKGALSSSSDPDIIDAVGFGEATYFQGFGPAPEISDYHFLRRIASRESNTSDFSLLECQDPVSVAALTKSASSDDDEPEDTSNDPADDSADVPQDDSQEDAPDDPSDDDLPEAPTDDIDEEQGTSTTEIGKALINKVYATENNDWIELYNPTDYDFNLASSSYRLEKTVTAESPSLIMRFGNTEDGTFPGGNIIKAHDNYLVVRDEADQYFKAQAEAIATRDEFGWTGSGYTIYLGTGAISSSTDPDIIDAVGFGPEASYFLGRGPAPEITDGYYLNRVQYFNDNTLDYNLILSDDPSLVSEPPDPDSDLFLPPTPISSQGIRNLWHFSECYGPGYWGVGKWDCARKIGIAEGGFSASLSPALDSNQMTLNFNYREVLNKFPRVIFDLKNDEGDKIRFMFEPGLLTIEGLPETEGRYYNPVIKYDEAWHQASLAINQAEDYWAVYIDGEEVIKQSFLARLAQLTKLEVTGDCDSYLLDEIAIWDRALSESEIKANDLKDAPFSPLSVRAGQEEARLIHYYDFEEDAGTVAADSVGQAPLQVAADAWTGRAHDNYAIKTHIGSDYTADFEEIMDSRDMSFAFWWQNSSYPIAGRGEVHLMGGDGNNKDLMAVLIDTFRPGYRFNEQYGDLGEGFDKIFPNDDKWHHFAFVYDSYRYKLMFYTDGREVFNAPYIWLPDGTRPSRLKISTNSDSSSIDNLAIYEGALSPAQVLKIYNETK